MQINQLIRLKYMYRSPLSSPTHDLRLARVDLHCTFDFRPDLKLDGLFGTTNLDLQPLCLHGVYFHLATGQKGGLVRVTIEEHES